VLVAIPESWHVLADFIGESLWFPNPLWDFTLN
jgi:hypothetical protein